MITIDQLKDVKERTEALYRYLDIENKKVQVEEEQLRTQAPGFWDDAKAAEEQMKKVKGIQKWLDGYADVKSLTDELDLAFEFYKEEMVTEQEVDDLYAKAIQAIEDLDRVIEKYPNVAMLYFDRSESKRLAGDMAGG